MNNRDKERDACPSQDDMPATGGEKEKKARLRKAARTAREALSQEKRSQGDREICRSILSCEAITNASAVLSYMACGGEVNLSLLHDELRRRGVKLCFPLCKDDGTMCAACPTDEDSFETGHFGISEPMLSRSEIVPPEELDMVLVPCIAFDCEGNRLGQGGGYYDRYLPKCGRAFTLAVAYEVQRADKIPLEGHDIKPKAVVTERAWYGLKFNLEI